MTFRHATLIHKHATQQQRRIIPGISLATATLVAVVLILVTSGRLALMPLKRRARGTVATVCPLSSSRPAPPMGSTGAAPRPPLPAISHWI